MIHTAESVTPWHPDKICDQISDAILDECLKQDPYSRVAVETMGGHGKIYLVGEITTAADVDYKQVARNVYFSLLHKEIKVVNNIVSQSPEIAQGVDLGGAGDQGIMVGYACNENEMGIPHELYLAKKLLTPFKIDGKSQITIFDEDNGKKITEVVLSVQGKTNQELKQYLSQFREYELANCYCNNTGAFTIGGFDADSGVTGRKIVVDAYGPRVAVGGGAFSGKDATKVDRSGAYMARFIALDLLKVVGMDEITVKLAYVIGKAQPVMMMAEYKDEKGAVIQEDLSKSTYDCRPQAIIERFGLRKPIYLQTARDGHFGIKNYPWEKT